MLAQSRCEEENTGKWFKSQDFRLLSPVIDAHLCWLMGQEEIDEC